MPGWSGRSRPAPGRRIALVDTSNAPVVDRMPVRCLLEMEDGSFIECAVMQMRSAQSPQSVAMSVGVDGRMYAPATIQPDLKISLEVIAVRRMVSPGEAVSAAVRMLGPADPEKIDAKLKEAKRVREADDAGLRRFAELELEDKKK